MERQGDRQASLGAGLTEIVMRLDACAVAATFLIADIGKSPLIRIVGLGVTTHRSAAL